MQHAPGDPRGVLGVLQVLEQDRELVAAESRHGRLGRTLDVVLRGIRVATTDLVAPAHRGAQTIRDLDEQLVAHRVAERVVDLLEAIDVEEEQREDLIGALRALEGDVDLLTKALAVRQRRERVVVGEMPNPPLGLDPLRDVPRRRLDATVAQPPRRELRPDPSVLAATLESTHAAQGHAAREVLERERIGVEIVRMEEVGDARGVELRAAHREELERGAVAGEDATVLAEHEDAVGGLLDQRAVVALARTERLFGRVPVVDVGHRAVEAQRPVVRRGRDAAHRARDPERRLALQRDPALLAIHAVAERALEVTQVATEILLEDVARPRRRLESRQHDVGSTRHAALAPLPLPGAVRVDPHDVGRVAGELREDLLRPRRIRVPALSGAVDRLAEQVSRDPCEIGVGTVLHASRSPRGRTPSCMRHRPPPTSRKIGRSRAPSLGC